MISPRRVKPLRGKMISLQSTFYKTLSPTANGKV